MKNLMYVVFVVFAIVMATNVYATQDNITMNSEVFSEHKKALVVLSHMKHSVSYKIPCVDCHHEKDEIQKCSTCHTEAKTLKKAIHKNCIGCHKTNLAGPVKCVECHPKK